jgi:hypothetical protein
LDKLLNKVTLHDLVNPEKASSQILEQLLETSVSPLNFRTQQNASTLLQDQ